jgi:WD40 repeat protein
LPDQEANAGTDVAVGLTRDGTLAVVRDTRGRAVFWDLTDRRRPMPLATAATPPGSAHVVFSPDGRLLVMGIQDSGPSLWDVTDRRHPFCTYMCQPPAKAGSEYGLVVAFSPDGRTLATGSPIGDDVTLWDVSDRSHPVKITVLPERSPSVKALDFGADGRLLLVADDAGPGYGAHLWDVSDLTRPRKLSTIPSHIAESAAFSPDHHLLVTGGWDELVHIWAVDDPAQPVEVATIAGHVWPITSVAFAPGDRHVLATRSGDGVLILWDVTHLAHIAADPMQAACSLAGPDLTQTEWKTYLPQIPYERLCP